MCKEKTTGVQECVGDTELRSEGLPRYWVLQSVPCTCALYLFWSGLISDDLDALGCWTTRRCQKHTWAGYCFLQSGKLCQTEHQGGILKHLEVPLSFILNQVTMTAGWCLSAQDGVCPPRDQFVSAAAPAQTHPQQPAPSRPTHFPVWLCCYLSVWLVCVSHLKQVTSFKNHFSHLGKSGA